MMNAFVECNERSIEGATAQVVHQDVFASALALLLLVAEFYAGRAWLIQDAEDLKPGGPEGLDCKEALVGIGVSGHAQNDFETFIARESQIGSLMKDRIQVRGQPVEQLPQRNPLVTEIYYGLRSCVFEQAFYGTDHRPRTVILRIPCVPTVPMFVIFDSCERRQPVRRCAVRGFK